MKSCSLFLHDSLKTCKTYSLLRAFLVSGFKVRICLQGSEAGKVEPNSLVKKPEFDMETDDSHPVCTGPGCSRQALPDSVYCGTDCILQHAAITMKTLSDPKVPKAKGRGSRKSAGDKPTAKVNRI